MKTPRIFLFIVWAICLLATAPINTALAVQKLMEGDFKDALANGIVAVLCWVVIGGVVSVVFRGEKWLNEEKS